MTKKKPSVIPPYHHGDLRRVLIDAALVLVTEEQDWDFSLREVARRAEVSHNAPYNHFGEKRDLLAALAALGFDRLRDGMLSATAEIDAADAALAMSGRTYVRLGVENPALYRLMFGPELADSTVVRTAGASTRAVLEGIILRGARSGLFAISSESERDLALAAVSAWSAVHGLTMLMIDRLVESSLSMQDMVERLIWIQVKGLG